MEDIPILYITEEDLTLGEYRFDIHCLVLEGVERGVEFDKDNISLLRIINKSDGYSVVLTVTKKTWLNSLEKCKNYFMEVEEYEYCERVRILEEKIKNGDI